MYAGYLGVMSQLHSLKLLSAEPAFVALLEVVPFGGRRKRSLGERRAHLLTNHDFKDVCSSSKTPSMKLVPPGVVVSGTHV